MPHCFTPDAFYTGKNVCSRNLFYQRASHHKTFSRRLIGLQTATLDTTQTTSTYPSAAILNSYLQQPIFSKFFKAAILSSYLQQSSCYCWVGGHLATFGVGGHLATVRISGHLATAGGCGHLATVVVGGHLAKFGLWVSYLISFCCCQGWWSAIPHHKNPFRLVVFEEKKKRIRFSVLQFFSRLQDLFQFFKASLQHGAQGSWTSSAVEFHDRMTSRTPVRSNPRNISSRCFYLSTSCFCAMRKSRCFRK